MYEFLCPDRTKVFFVEEEEQNGEFFSKQSLKEINPVIRGNRLGPSIVAFGFVFNQIQSNARNAVQMNLCIKKTYFLHNSGKVFTFINRCSHVLLKQIVI